MNFILYLISCIVELFCTMVGASTGHQNRAGWGVLILLTIFILWGSSLFILSRTKLNYKWVVSLSIIITVLLIAIFCIICIIVEIM